MEHGQRRGVMGTILSIARGMLELPARVRGLRRLAVLVLYLAIVLGAWAVAWRWSRLRELPDLGEQVYGESSTRPTDDRNAFVLYRRAAERARDMGADESRSFSEANLDAAKADATLLRWVADNREAIALMVDGARRPDAYFGGAESPVDLEAKSRRVELAIKLSWIGTAALFEAGRVRAAGDPAGAWDRLLAVVRASRHIDRAEPSAYSTALIMVQYARVPISDWAGDPGVDESMLRRALDDLSAAEALRLPPSHFHRACYRALEVDISGAGPILEEWSRRRPAAEPWDILVDASGLDIFLKNEPARSVRLLRLLAANDLAWCDRPLSERPVMLDSNLRIYARAPGIPGTIGVDPKKLVEWAKDSPIGPPLAKRLAEADQLYQVDRWSIGELLKPIAWSLFTRETGHPPASEAEALRRYRPPPGDSPGRDEAEPIDGQDLVKP